jgi:single-strand DNA-binding protein
MASYNRVILVGNLTRDPQLKYLPSQTPVVDFGLAMNRRYKTAQGEDREEVCFVDVTAFGRQAEVINQYCQKGRPLLVEGHLKLDEWEDKNGGGKRSKLKVMVDNFQLLGSGPGGGGGGAPANQDYQSGDDPAPRQPRPAQRPPQAAPRQAPPAQPSQAAQPPISEEPQFKDDDIPF